MITRITKAYTRLYSDNGQETAYVEWIDSHGRSGRTEGRMDRGKIESMHMKALMMRACREGVSIGKERW